MTDLTELDRRLHNALTRGDGHLLTTLTDDIARAGLPMLAQLLRERTADLLHGPACLTSGDRTSSHPDRTGLAADVAAALHYFDPDDEVQRRALIRRITDEGIEPGMHAREITGGQPLTLIQPNRPVCEGLVAQDNLAAMFNSQLTMLDWPRNKRIEYELGQLLFLLDTDRS